MSMDIVVPSELHTLQFCFPITKSKIDEGAWENNRLLEASGVFHKVETPVRKLIEIKVYRTALENGIERL